jgi:hypothetical protein
MKWISVKDKLPGQLQGRVLVTMHFDAEYMMPGDYVDTAHYHHRHKVWLGDDDQLVEYQNDVHVTYWMPLPEPPNEKK